MKQTNYPFSIVDSAQQSCSCAEEMFPVQYIGSPVCTEGVHISFDNDKGRGRMWNGNDVYLFEFEKVSE